MVGIVSRRGGFASHFCPGFEGPSCVFGIAIDLNDLIDVILNMNSLDGTPNCYKFVRQIHIDFHDAMLSRLSQPYNPVEFQIDPPPSGLACIPANPAFVILAGVGIPAEVVKLADTPS